LVAATLIGCELAYSQSAESSAVISGEQYLQQFLDDARTLQAEFYQELSDADGQLIEVATGTMSLQRPNRFLWQYRDPLEQLILADGEYLWIYDVELDQATVTPLSDIIEATPAMLLSGDQAVRDGFDTLENFVADELSWVRLAPNVPGSDFRSVLIGFMSGELARLELIDGLEQVTRIAFSDVVVNQDLDSGLFEFEPPAGVDVIGEQR
jgi:outer membrane lipoprotein carrier protein